MHFQGPPWATISRTVSLVLTWNSCRFIIETRDEQQTIEAPGSQITFYLSITWANRFKTFNARYATAEGFRKVPATLRQPSGFRFSSNFLHPFQTGWDRGGWGGGGWGSPSPLDGIWKLWQWNLEGRRHIVQKCLLWGPQQEVMTSYYVRITPSSQKGPSWIQRNQWGVPDLA